MNKVKISVRTDKIEQLDLILKTYPTVYAMVVNEGAFAIGFIYYEAVEMLLTAVHDMGLHYMQITFTQVSSEIYDPGEPTESGFS